jgi:signal transduction histidine kinase
LVSGAGAVVTALVFGPLSSAIRRWVDQLFYGRRRDPYAIVSVLVRRLGDVAGPEDALVGIAAALCTELRIPYVSIAAASGALLAEQGQPEPRDEPSRFELHHQGNRVGTLSVGHRRGEAQLAGREERLLADLARHVGAAVHAASLVADLRLARDRLVHAREEERRRLQRDLHDGLGPRLTAVKLMVDAATNHLSRHPEEARPQLQSARSELGVAVADIRRLVNQLGDPALDSLGLVGAIKELGTRFAHDGLDVTVDAGWVPPLPPAIEVAAFRIASEALANVARHAGASRCDIRIVAGTSLRLTITDDGHGLSPSMRHGVGLVSMEQRATELGGQCVVTTGPPGGVEVCVDLPLPDSNDAVVQEIQAEAPKAPAIEVNS